MAGFELRLAFEVEFELLQVIRNYIRKKLGFRFRGVAIIRSGVVACIRLLMCLF